MKDDCSPGQSIANESSPDQRGEEILLSNMSAIFLKSRASGGTKSSYIYLPLLTHPSIET